MRVLVDLNDYVYHSMEVFLCDIKIAFLEARIARRQRRIAQLEAKLK